MSAIDAIWLGLIALVVSMVATDKIISRAKRNIDDAS